MLGQEFNEGQVWEDALGELEVSISGPNFGAWIKPCFIDSIRPMDEERLLIELACPSNFHRNTIDQRYYGQIKQIFEKLTGKRCEMAMVIKPRVPASIIEQEEVEEKVDLFNYAQVDREDAGKRLMEAGLNPRFDFENLIVGNSNNLAYAAAEGVVNAPGSKHNPLFIWGGVGLGKTHLMHAVGRALLLKGLKVQAITSEQFTNEFVYMLKNKTVEAFKQKYRGVQALLIDDIQFFSGKEAAQEEFFHTFNELMMKGGQIIMTSDRRPQEIEQVEQRLISRFLGGLTVDIGLPDYEMRLAILRQKVAELRIEADEAAIDLLAMSINTNTREIEGILSQLANAAAVHGGGRITAEMIEKEIGVRSNKEVRMKLRPQQVISMVAKQFDYKNKDILGGSRKADLVRARHITMYMLRNEMGLTLQSVAELMGGRDHTTIMHAVEKMEKELGVNQEVREQIMRVKQELYH